MKHLIKIKKRTGSSIENLCFFEDMDSSQSTCTRRNILPISIICVEANPLNCLYYRRGTGECGYKIPKEEYANVPIELIKSLRDIRKCQ